MNCGHDDSIGSGMSGRRCCLRAVDFDQEEQTPEEPGPSRLELGVGSRQRGAH